MQEGIAMTLMSLASLGPTTTSIICTAAPLLERGGLALGPRGRTVPKVVLAAYARTSTTATQV